MNNSLVFSVIYHFVINSDGAFVCSEAVALKKTQEHQVQKKNLLLGVGRGPGLISLVSRAGERSLQRG